MMRFLSPRHVNTTTHIRSPKRAVGYKPSLAMPVTWFDDSIVPIEMPYIGKVRAVLAVIETPFGLVPFIFVIHSIVIAPSNQNRGEWLFAPADCADVAARISQALRRSGGRFR